MHIVPYLTSAKTGLQCVSQPILRYESGVSVKEAKQTAAAASRAKAARPSAPKQRAPPSRPDTGADQMTRSED